MMKFTSVFVAAVIAQGASAQGCSPLELIYARATTEPKGYGAAGARLVSTLANDLPGSTAYAVVYPASMSLQSSACVGVQDVIRRITERGRACPNQKFALGGHSQGGVVITTAIPSIPKELLSRVVAVTNFGTRPCSDVPQVAGKCKSFCNKSDNICDGKGGPLVTCGGGKGRLVDTLVESNATYPEVFDSAPLLTRQMGGKSGKLSKGSKSNGDSSASSGGSGSGNGCGADERGHAVKGTGLQAHMAYKSDGYYVTAASCYITKKFKEAK